MSSGQEERVDTSVPAPGEETAKWRPPPRRGDAGYRKRPAVIDIAAVPGVVCAVLLLCETSYPGVIPTLLGNVFRGESFSVFLLITVPAVLEGVVLVPGIYSLAKRSRRAGVVALVMGVGAGVVYVAYTGMIWFVVLMVTGIGRHGAAIAH